MGGETSRALNRTLRVFLLSLAAAVSLPASQARAQAFNLEGADLQKRADGVLTMLSYSVTPDASAGSLSIDSGTTDNPKITSSILGAGFTVATGFPLYMEGFLGYSRYDPTFLASNGTEQRKIPAKWNSISATIGLGWDFELMPGLYLRPIVNASLGHVESDLSLAGRALEYAVQQDFEFLDGGDLNAYGLGGSLMLDYGIYEETHEIDIELRYTYIRLNTYNTSDAVEGGVDAETLSLWSRWRQPTGLVLFRRPVRYVLEGTASVYLGDQRGALGFDHLSSAGAGLEFDFSRYSTILTRVRVIGRYLFGNNVSGYSGGISISFF